MNRLHRVIISSFIAITLFIFVCLPVLAIVNPDDIAFGTGTEPDYGVFYDVLEEGDILFVAEGLVEYAIIPTDYSANESYLFEVLNTIGTEVYLSTPLNEYNNRPISIYQSAAQVTALGLTVGTAYGLRITPNPLVMVASEGVNQITAYLDVADYTDQMLGIDNGVPTANPLRNFLIDMAENIQTYDSPTDDYLVAVQGYYYLSLTGGDIFIEGIPALTSMCPILFQAGLESIQSDKPSSYGSYGSALNPQNQWGDTVSMGLTNIGVYLGVNQALAGSVVLLFMVIMLGVFIYAKTQSGIVVLLLLGAAPFMGAYLGLMPLALAFIFVIVMVTLLGYYFFSRGAL